MTPRDPAEVARPIRVQLRRTKGWRMPENTVKVDRTTKWGNPFAVGADGPMARAMGPRRRKVMTDLIDLTAERNARAQPDPEFVRKDEYGRPLYCFGFEFERQDGKRFGFEMWCLDFAEAELQAAAINANGVKVTGRLMSTVPA